MPNKKQPPEQWVHKVRVGTYKLDGPDIDEKSIEEYRHYIEPWLGALLQADHLNLLVGNGLTTAITNHMNISEISMSADEPASEYGNAVLKTAKKNAAASGRRKPNIEHVIGAALELIQGIKVILVAPDSQDSFLQKAKSLHIEWVNELKTTLKKFLQSVLNAEKEIKLQIERSTEKGQSGKRLLASFLLTFVNRTASRDRLHVFTTNYDRLVEYGADLLGLRIIDRFVGGLEPAFRASRLGIDMHYNPPGIREEPRYLEGVIRMTKLHGSIDWRSTKRTERRDRIVRTALPFGPTKNHPHASSGMIDTLIIYPNPAKDIETIAYPYVELFRDFAAAICRPNAVLITYGYGFGDDHINRILQDMLTIPSTHIVIISYNDNEGKIQKFCKDAGCDEQISLLIGNHFGDLETLVDHYLPKPATEHINWKLTEFLKKRPRDNSPDIKDKKASTANTLQMPSGETEK